MFLNCLYPFGKVLYFHTPQKAFPLLYCLTSRQLLHQSWVRS